MRLYREPAGIPADAKGAYAAIGNFDGVHRGHQAVIGEAIRLARAAGRKAAVVTFEPHPRRLFKPDLPPFLLSLALFVLGFLGLVLGMWPYLLPPSMTLWQAAAPASSLGFTLVGLVILLPVILGYTAWSYRVFRGKVQAGAGYH